MPECRNLEEVIKNVKPTALIGAAAQPKTFTKEIIEEMTRNNERPVSVSYYLLTRQTRCFQRFWNFHVVFIVNNHHYC